MNISTPAISIYLYLIAAFLGALGQYLYKEGGTRIQTPSPWSLITNVRLVAGVLCYVGVGVLFVVGLRKGGQLAVLYPVYATTFVWGALIGVFVLGESFTLPRMMGIALIIAGVIFVVR